MQVVDSNGQSEIVATLLTVVKTEDAISKILQVIGHRLK